MNAAIPDYRGMHSFEVAFENWFVPAENLIGGENGAGRGFYLKMKGFRKRALADRGARDRGDAGGIRGGARLCRRAAGVRPADR